MGAARSTIGEPDRGDHPGLRGRAREWEWIRGAFATVEQGRAALVLLEGEAGIGKSRLVEEVEREWLARGHRLLSARADELGGRRRAGPLAELLRAGDARVPRTSDDGVVIDALLDLVEGSAVAEATAVVVEDLHWADPATLDAIRMLVRRLAYLPVLIVCTYRPHPRPDGLARLIDDASRAEATIIDIDPLEDADAIAVVEALVGGSLGPALLKMVQAAAGNPLYLTEVVHSLRAAGALREDGSTVDAGIEELLPDLRITILRRLSFLPGETLRALRSAAILGASFTVEDLSATSQSPVADLADALEPALRSKVLVAMRDGLRFRHDLLREAIYEDIAPPVRASLHLEAAHALAAASAAPDRVAEHLLRAPAEAGEGLIGLLEQTAETLEATEPRLAIELLERARDMERDPARADRHAMRMLLPLSAIGRGPEAVEIADRLLRSPLDVGDEADVRLARVRALQRDGKGGETVDELRSLVADERLDDGQRLFARVALAAAFIATVQPDQALALAEQTIPEARAAGDRDLVAGALYWAGVAAMLQGRTNEALTFLSEAKELDQHRRLQLTSGYAGYALALLQADRLDEARVVLDEGRRRERDVGGMAQLATLMFFSGTIEALVGRWDEAIAEAETGLRMVAESGGSVVGIFSAFGTLAYATLSRGDRAAAEGWVAEADRVVMERGPQPAYEVVAWCRSMCMADAGDVAGAAENLWATWELIGPIRFGLSWALLAPDLIKLLLRAEQRDRAIEVAAGAEEGAERSPGLGYARASALRSRGLVEDDPEMLMAAVEAVRGSQRRMDFAFTADDAARVLARHGQNEQARALFEEVIGFYEQAGAHRLIADATAAMRAAGIRRGSTARRRRPVSGWEALTPAELAVARLAAEGLTNPQIAERLVVSKYTVMTHLQHVFAKLAITSRVELAARVAREDVPS